MKKIFSAILLASINALADPYQLETLQQEPVTLTEPVPALIKTHHINGEQLYKTIESCHPERSLFDIEVSLEGRATKRYEDRIENEAIIQDSLDGNYIALVAKMPLYSTQEVWRRSEMEAQRRRDVATKIGALIESVEKRNLATRKVSLYTQLEKRSQLRVTNGLALVDEQVLYLEKLAISYEEQKSKEAEIKARMLELLAYCENNQRNKVKSIIEEMLQNKVIYNNVASKTGG